jgi:hypothetical protein
MIITLKDLTQENGFEKEDRKFFKSLDKKELHIEDLIVESCSSMLTFPFVTRLFAFDKKSKLLRLTTKLKEKYCT